MRPLTKDECPACLRAVEAGQHPNRLVLDLFVTTGRSGREPDDGACAPTVP
jgi:hypothetical protein